MRERRLWRAAALGVALWACNGDKDETDATGDTADTVDTDTPGTTSTGPTRVATILALPGDAAAAEGNFNILCAGCHGADGAGIPPNPALTERVPAATDEVIVTTLLEGKGNMDAFGFTLNNQEIADLLAYVRTNFGN